MHAWLSKILVLTRTHLQIRFGSRLQLDADERVEH